MSVEFLDTEQLSYDVQADRLMAAAETILRMDEAAKTEWFPRYDYETTGEVLSSAVVTVKTKITMPQWSGYGTACQGEKDEWDRFCLALRTHEQGHIELVVEHLSGIDERLVGNSVDAAERIWATALDSLKSANRAYDRETDHGQNQGAIVDVSVAGP